MTDQDTSQARFRDLVAAHWAAVDNGDTKTADHRTEELNQLVTKAAENGKTGGLLLPLLSETESPAVRVAAATYALTHGHEAAAVPVLEDLSASDDIGLVAEDADMVLLSWKKQR